jgi:hypothetical protein
MKGKHGIEIKNPRQSLHRIVNINQRLSPDEDMRFKAIMYKIIEEPF